ncbi:ABC transporter ATP-binding protein [Salinibacterium sp. dk2585]|uniref:ABC transporter ATP-binding protein n=1 Tax=unclassified Salinibacterium TaxID=2632331 RepID=UPI0011C247CE|nr:MULTISPECIES: ABC transporter ATP-binding protein [unclassified Salinibacterium]QEE61733.1 ABC transporter ATP-binding protein [Salinibacterium sp. dk2585]TXK54712.1 ABC transporter ATP-binding protein [Salinibacterium sp. dk5596]
MTNDTSSTHSTASTRTIKTSRTESITIPEGVALSVQHIKKVYQTDAGDIEAVRDLHFDIREGEFVCLVGPSGSGKTTLLKCIAGLLAPTSGIVALDGKLVTGPPKGLAVVFQEYGRSLFPWMNIRDNVELPLKNQGVAKAERDRLVDEALQAVGLDHVPKSYPWQLSGGMQQRVAIARAVAYQPKVLLMDEPFAAVDAQTRADLEDLVRRVWKQLGITVLFVTHDIDESVYLGERVVVLSSSPTVVQEDLHIDLPEERDQLSTRSLPRFTELRGHVYEQIQRAKAEAATGSTATRTP